jgi:LAGLIDADG DNA endonuclease family
VAPPYYRKGGQQGDWQKARGRQELNKSKRLEQIRTGSQRQETKNGLKSNILNKIKDTIFGQKNIILKGMYGKENLNNNGFLIKISNEPCPLLPPSVAPLRGATMGQRLRALFYSVLYARIKPEQRKEGFTVHTKITKMNQMYQNKEPKTSSFLGSTRRLKNISAQMQPQHTKIFFHTRCRAINRIGPHNTDIISTIFGLLLGDGYAINRTGEGVRISIRQSIIHKEYLFSLYDFFFFRGYCSNLIPRKYNRTIKGIDKIYSGYEFNTFTFRSFVWIYNSFYKKGKKKLPLNIEEFITPLTLAI